MDSSKFHEPNCQYILSRGAESCDCVRNPVAEKIDIQNLIAKDLLAKARAEIRLKQPFVEGRREETYDFLELITAILGELDRRGEHIERLEGQPVVPATRIVLVDEPVHPEVRAFAEMLEANLKTREEFSDTTELHLHDVLELYRFMESAVDAMHALFDEDFRLLSPKRMHSKAVNVAVHAMYIALKCEGGNDDRP